MPWRRPGRQLSVPDEARPSTIARLHPFVPRQFPVRYGSDDERWSLRTTVPTNLRRFGRSASLRVGASNGAIWIGLFPPRRLTY